MPVRSLVAAVEKGRSLENEIGRATPEMAPLGTLGPSESSQHSPQYSLHNTNRFASQHLVPNTSIHSPSPNVSKGVTTETTSHVPYDSPNPFYRSTATTSSSTHDHPEYPIPYLTSIMGGSRDDGSTTGGVGSSTTNFRVGSLENNARDEDEQEGAFSGRREMKRELSRDGHLSFEASLKLETPLARLPGPFELTKSINSKRHSYNNNTLREDEIGGIVRPNNNNESSLFGGSLGTGILRQSHISGGPDVNNNSNTLMPPRVPSPTDEASSTNTIAGEKGPQLTLMSQQNNNTLAAHINMTTTKGFHHASERSSNTPATSSQKDNHSPLGSLVTINGGKEALSPLITPEGPSSDTAETALPLTISALPLYVSYTSNRQAIPSTNSDDHFATIASSGLPHLSTTGGQQANDEDGTVAPPSKDGKEFHSPLLAGPIHVTTSAGDSTSYGNPPGPLSQLNPNVADLNALGNNNNFAHPPYSLSLAYNLHRNGLARHIGHSSPNTLNNSPRSATSIRGVVSHVTGDTASLASSLTGGESEAARVVIGKQSSPTPDDGPPSQHEFGLPAPAPNTQQSFRSFLSNNNLPHAPPPAHGTTTGIHPSWARDPTSHRASPSLGHYRNRRASIEEGLVSASRNNNQQYFSSTNNNNYSITNPNATNNSGGNPSTELQDSFVGQWIKGSAGVVLPTNSNSRFNFGFGENATSISEMHFNVKEKDFSYTSGRRNNNDKSISKGQALSTRSSTESIADFLSQYTALKASFWGDTSASSMGAHALKQYEQLDVARSRTFGQRLMTLVENFCIKASEDDEGTMNYYRFDSFRQMTSSTVQPPEVLASEISAQEKGDVDPSSAGPSTARVTFRDDNSNQPATAGTSGAASPTPVASPTTVYPSGNNGSMSSRSNFRGVGFLSEDNLITNFKSQKAVKKTFNGRPNSAETTISTASALIANVDETRTVKKSTDDAGFATINQYAIVMPIGKGTQGKVKLVSNENGETFAMKVVPKSLLRRAMLDRLEEEERLTSPDGGSPKRLLTGIDHEIAVMKKVRHKNIIALYEVIDDPGSKFLYLIMQYADKGPVVKIDPKTLTCKPLDPAIAAKYLRQLINGLRYLHRKKIIHRDIKPDNMLVTGDHTICIADFGVSEMLENGNAIRGIQGTHIFFPPEMLQARGAEEMSGPAVDVWALGVSVFFMVFGLSPFIGSTPDEITKKIINCEIQYPPQVQSEPEKWQDWKEVFDAILCKDPADRIQLRDLKELKLLRNLDMDGNERPAALITINKSYNDGGPLSHRTGSHRSERGPLYSRDDEHLKANSNSDSNTALSGSGSTAAPRNGNTSNSDHGSNSSNTAEAEAMAEGLEIGSRPPPMRKATMAIASDDEGDFMQTICITQEELKAAVRTVKSFMGGEAEMMLTSPTAATPPAELRSPNTSGATAAPPFFEASMRSPSVNPIEGSGDPSNHTSLIDHQNSPFKTDPSGAVGRSMSVMALAPKGQQLEEQRRDSDSPNLGPATILAPAVPSPHTVYASPVSNNSNHSAFPMAVPMRNVASPTPPTSKQPLHMRPASPSVSLSATSSKASSLQSSNNTSGTTTTTVNNNNSNPSCHVPQTMPAIPTVSATGTSTSSTPIGSPLIRRYAGGVPASPDIEPLVSSRASSPNPNPRKLGNAYRMSSTNLNSNRSEQGVMASGIAGSMSSNTGVLGGGGGGGIGIGLQKPKVGVYSAAFVNSTSAHPNDLLGNSSSPLRPKNDEPLRKNQSHGALLGRGGATTSHHQPGAVGFGFRMNGTASANHSPSSPFSDKNTSNNGNTFSLGIRGLLHTKTSATTNDQSSNTPRGHHKVNQSFSYMSSQQQAEVAKSSTPTPRGISVPHHHSLVANIDADQLENSLPIGDSNGNSVVGGGGGGTHRTNSQNKQHHMTRGNLSGSDGARSGSTTITSPSSNLRHLPEITNNSRPTSSSGHRGGSLGGTIDGISLVPLPVKRASVTSFDAAAGSSGNTPPNHNQHAPSTTYSQQITHESSNNLLGAPTTTTSPSSPVSIRELSKPRTSLYANRVGQSPAPLGLGSPRSQENSPTSVPKPRHLPKLM